MRVAALYDIHGNLPALEAVLNEVHQLKVDKILVGGDVVLGPMSQECLDLLMSLKMPTHFIKGNCEVAVINASNGKPIPNLPEKVLKDIHWTVNQLFSHHFTFMEQWPLTLTMEIKDLGNVLFCHATPENENDIFTRLTPEKELLSIFEKIDVNHVVCGHTHMQFDRKIGSVRVINAGSVGMPFGDPGAYWLLLDGDIDLRCTTYHLQNAADRIMATAYPDADSFAKNNVINPPSEELMLGVFNGYEHT